MLKSYKYRIYPTKQQGELLDKHFNACRFVYNLALETKQYAYTNYRKNLSAYDLIKQLTELKKEYNWLCELDSQALQASISNMDSAYKKFFAKTALRPKYKSKQKSKQSYSNLHGRCVYVDNNKIFFPKFRQGVSIILHKTFEGKIKRYTITKASTGKYYISILFETAAIKPEKKPISVNATVGIDLGIKDFAVTSDGIKYENPKHLKNNLQRLKVLQRRLSRKKKGSANRDKARHKVAVAHERVTNCRKDFLHKLSSHLVNNHDSIVMEDLNIQGMVKNHKLAQSISDVSWGEFERQLKYKCEWYGKNFFQIPRFEPSTKRCSKCEVLNEVLTLADREWACANCGTLHDRDINAAINIKNYFIKHSPKGIRVETVESSTLVGAMKQEVNF